MATLGLCVFPQTNIVAAVSSRGERRFAHGTSVFAISNSNAWTGNSARLLSVRRRASHRILLPSPRRHFCRAEVGEESVDVAPENAKTGESNPSPPKGFGSPKTLVKDKKGSSSKAASSSSGGGIRRAPPSQPLLKTQEGDQQMLKTESRVVAFLGVLFVVIIVQGLILAASGFLPEEFDEIISKFFYPAFSPTVGIFFIIAAGYGLWKASSGEAGKGGS